jgi:hypothetical protein
MADGVYLSFVANVDKALIKVACACRVDGVMAWAPKVHVPIPLLSWNLSILKEDLSADAISQIGEMDHIWQESRTTRMFTSEETHISFEQLDELIGQLEEQVVAYCGN